MSDGPGTSRAVGRVVATRAFPVKGAGTLPADGIRLDADGVVGDRRHAVVTDTGDLLGADAEPRLRDVLATAEPTAAAPCSRCRPAASGARPRTPP